MFRDHPEITGNGYTSVFSGALDIEARSPTEKEVLRLAKKYADELFITQ